MLGGAAAVPSMHTLIALDGQNSSALAAIQFGT